MHSLAVERLVLAADIMEFGNALYAARECFSLEELAPYEQRFQALTNAPL
jgi:hypothetical protein